MGLLQLLGRLVSNNPLVLIVAGPQSQQISTSRAEDVHSLHFFTLAATHFSILYSGINLLLLISVSGQPMRYIVESTILLGVALITYICVSVERSQVKQDVILALMITTILVTDQSQRHKWDLSHFSLSSHVITYMFTMTGLRRTGLILVWSVSEVIRLTVSAAANDWRALLTSVIKDIVCLAYGLCVYFCIYYVGTEILRFRYRPRLALQDFIGLQRLEYRTFTALKDTFSPGFPVLTENDNINILLQMPQIMQTRHSILQTLGGEVGSSSHKYMKATSESTRLTEEKHEHGHFLREKQEALKNRLQQISSINPRSNVVTNTASKMESQSRSRATAAGILASPGRTGAGDAVPSRSHTRQKTVTFSGAAQRPQFKISPVLPHLSNEGRTSLQDRTEVLTSIDAPLDSNELTLAMDPSDQKVSATEYKRLAKVEELKMRRKQRRARSLAIRGDASAFLIHSNPTAGIENDEMPEESRPNGDQRKSREGRDISRGRPTSQSFGQKVSSAFEQKVNTRFHGLRLAGRQGIIIRGSVPLFLKTRKTWVERVFPFILNSATEAVMQEANWRREPPAINTDNWFGRFADVKVERWFLSWKTAAVTRLFFVSYQWLFVQQVLTLIVASGAADGMLFAPWKLNRTGSKQGFLATYLCRILMHIIVTGAFFGDRYLVRRKSWLDWTDIAAWHVTLARLYAYFLLACSVWDFCIVATHTSDITQTFDRRVSSFLYQLTCFPFLLHYCRGPNSFLFGLMVVIFCILHPLFGGAPMTLPQIFPLIAGCLFQMFCVVKPLEMNYRRIFAIFALPYLLYLESLKPPGMGSGLADEEDINLSVEGSEYSSSETEQDRILRQHSSQSQSTSKDLADFEYSKTPETEQWIYKGARQVDVRRGTQIFNQPLNQR